MRIMLWMYCIEASAGIYKSTDGLWIKAPTPPTITPGFYGRVG